MTTFDQVVKAWQGAHVDAIHPLRADDVDGYWSSGWFQAQQAAAHIPAGGSVVDFGCGDGRLSIPLAHMGFGVTAVDASPNMLKRLRAAAKKQANDFNPDDLELVQSDGTDLSKLKRQFDAVVCRAVLIHHSPADQKRLVHNLSDLLKSGGVFVADWPVGDPHERLDWIDVTVVSVERRNAVAWESNLELVEEHTDGLTVWRRSA